MFAAQMTAEEVFESVTNGGTSDFAAAVEILEGFGPWCLIGGLAVNCFAEPVYTVDADFVVGARHLEEVKKARNKAGFRIKEFPHSINARRPESKLNLQLTTDLRYEDFTTRAEPREVLGRLVPVASLPDIVCGKVWARNDLDRRLTKRKRRTGFVAPGGSLPRVKRRNAGRSR